MKGRARLKIPIALTTITSIKVNKRDSESSMDPESLNALAAKKDAIETMLLGFDKNLIFYGLAVVIGVAGEVWYGARTWIASKELRSIQLRVDAEKDRLTTAEVARTNSEISRANQAAAEAKERTANAELALEKLKNEQAWRVHRLNTSSFIDFLKGNPAGKASVWVIPENEEARIFAVTIAGCLGSAGWNVTSAINIPNLPPEMGSGTNFLRATGGLSALSGVVIRCSKLTDRQDKHSPLGCLLSAFEMNGMPVGVMSTDFADHLGYKDAVAGSLAKDEIIVVIGARY